MVDIFGRLFNHLSQGRMGMNQTTDIGSGQSMAQSQGHFGHQVGGLFANHRGAEQAAIAFIGE